MQGQTDADFSMSQEQPPANSDASLLKQYEIVIGVYQHHFELLVKALAVYLALVGALVGYTFQKDVEPVVKTVLLLFVSLTSVVGVGALVCVRSWLHELGCLKGLLESNLGLYAFPFSAARRISLAIVILVALIGIAALIVAFSFSHSRK